MDIEKVINLAAEAGKLMLESGAETYRVEETITRICIAYGIKNADSFVLTTGIMLSAINEYGRTVSIVKRVKSRTVDLEKIAQINQLSRNIKVNGLTTDDFIRELKSIRDTKHYTFNLIIISSCLGASFFTLLFGGNLKDFFVSFFIGGIIKYVSLKFSKFKINDFFTNAVGGALSALIALFSIKLGLGSNLDTIIIGSIMLLVPGLAITNAIRDTIAGDLIAGLSRAAEAFFIAVSIAAGVGIVIQLWYHILGGM